MQRDLSCMAWLAAFVIAVCSSPAAAQKAANNAEPIFADEWFEAHGAPDTGVLDLGWNCVETNVGPDSAPALVCDTHDDVSRDAGAEPAFRALVRRVVRVVRGGKVVTVLDVITKLEVYDAPGPDWPPIFELALKVKGNTAVLADRGECAKLPARQVRSDFHVAWENLDRDVAARMCKARGTYRWKAGRFVRGR